MTTKENGCESRVVMHSLVEYTPMDVSRREMFSIYPRLEDRLDVTLPCAHDKGIGGFLGINRREEQGRIRANDESVDGDVPTNDCLFIASPIPFC